ncbi:hypothetical protein [Bradyrhizobium sp. th.b2]|uniref:hypothetical protein n=1 Tax=Bradyrhizobium sp. th-b2 TaxID=172088 RepID=UPI000491F7B1|nr:hypothetical protein [Bradyrhizobium sp. th.b2]
MSFQRRVGNGSDANRGTLPIHIVKQSIDAADVLAPLLAGEDVWIALQLANLVSARGSASDGRRLRTAVRDLPSLHLLMVDGVEDATGIQPLSSFVPAAAAADISWQLEFVIEQANSACRVRAQFVTDSLYSDLSGLPLPARTSSKDGFTGKRLP